MKREGKDLGLYLEEGKKPKSMPRCCGILQRGWQFSEGKFSVSAIILGALPHCGRLEFGLWDGDGDTIIQG